MTCMMIETPYASLLLIAILHNNTYLINSAHFYNTIISSSVWEMASIANLKQSSLLERENDPSDGLNFV